MRTKQERKGSVEQLAATHAATEAAQKLIKDLSDVISASPQVPDAGAMEMPDAGPPAGAWRMRGEERK